jgi:hypothetical protein
MPPDRAPKLRLVRPRRDVIPFERRRRPRLPASGEGMAAWTSPGDGLCGRVTPVRLLDLSAGGLGLASDEPIAAGTHIAVVLQRPGAGVWTGRVARCDRIKGEYRIGVAFPATRAA